MYLILVYDVEVRKVAKIHKFLKTKLNWVQNSVFEGEVSESELVKIKTRLKKMTNRKYDSVIMYTLFSHKYTKRTVIGMERNRLENVI